MIIDDQYYDVIIVGTGAGGGTLARKLAPSGKKILVLERGGYLEKESSELVDVEVFKKEQYHAPEQWYDNAGEPFYPQTNYSVGGNTKVYSGALLRMRERDFTAVPHQNGMSPAWELTYADFEPYYTKAEQLYQVHGKLGDDVTEPPHSADYPFPAIDHEPQIAALCDAFSKQGLHPSHLPLGLGDQGRTDSEDSGITPALAYDNVTFKSNAKAVCLHTNPSGTAIKAVEAEVDGQSYLFLGHLVVLSCGAINSAVLLLRSANETHPNGIANRTGLVGCNLMKQLMTVIVQRSANPNSGLFQRTVYFNDFYWGNDSFPYPMGHIQNSGGILQDVIFAEAPPLLSVLAKLMPGSGLRQLATRTIGWWLQTEDLPNPNNRVSLSGEKITLHYEPNNLEAHDRLLYHWQEALKEVDKTMGQSVVAQNIHPHAMMPVQVVAHQCGTCRFGSNPDTSVLDLNCRTHEVDNLYVVDSSFFPSSSSTSPALTVMANALRVGDHLIERLK